MTSRWPALALTALGLCLVGPVSSASATVLPTTITENMTLAPAGNPYTGGSITIEPGVTVSVEPGVEFEIFKLTVKGTLKAEGTAENPIVFTGAEEKVNGEWSQIRFEAGSGASVLDHTEVKYGGGNGSSVLVNGSSPRIANSVIRNSWSSGISVTGGGSPEIAGNLVYAHPDYGIKYQAISAQTGEVNIHDNFVEGGTHGIYVDISSTGSVAGKSLGGNLITKTTTTALYYRGLAVPDNITGNTLIANTSNVIKIGGSTTVATSQTWTDGGVPIRFEGTVTVAVGATLKITKGVLLQEPTMVVKGALKAEGTAEEPVVFTSVAEKFKGEWSQLRFEAGSGASVIDYAEFRYGGGNGSTIRVNGASSPTITNSLVYESSGAGIYVAAGGAPEIADNFVIGSNNYGIRYAAAGTQTGEVNIHDNFVEGGENGIYVESTSTGTIVGKSLGANLIVGTGAPLFYKGLDVPGNITGNTLVGNVSNVIRIGGSSTVATSQTWNDGGVPVRIEGTVTVAAGVTLNITKGVLLTYKPNLTVKGTLKAEGTAAEPVVFTGAWEEAGGEWSQLRFEAGSGASVLDHVEVKHGGGNGSSILVNGSSPTITNSVIRKSYDYAIKVVAPGAPKIERNRFRDNPNGLTYNGTSKLMAPNNDWGCASGPKPAGCGESVTSNVEWKPAVQIQEPDGQCRGQDSQCGEGADPVSLATGQLSYSHRDLLLTNKSDVPLEFTRSYSSGSAADTGLGPGWAQTGLASATELPSGAVLILRQDGRQDLFQKTETGYKAPSGVTSTLAKVEGTFQLTTLERTVYSFDASGRIAGITDDHGLKTTYGYDANGRLATITDPSSQTLTFSYDTSNHITAVKDSTGREVKYTYSTAGDLATVTDALGGVTEYTYDAEHRLKTIKDPRGNVILKNTYDSQGRIVEQRDGLENLWKLEYKETETVVTEPEGGKLTYGFDAQKRVVSEKDQLGHTTTTSYDAAGNVDEIVQPGGAKWQFGHDTAGNLTSVIDPEEGERSYEYDAQNRLTGFTDERGETWTYEWDEGNDLVKVTDPAEGETTFTHDASGLPLTVTDPEEHTTTFSYDTRGNLLTAKDALEQTTTFAYNARNQLISKTEPGLEPETYGRNALGELLSLATPEGHKTEYAYDGNGMPTQITDPAGNVWKIEYNAMERPVAYVDPLEGKMEIDYDGNLNPVATTDRRGKETTYAYDLANQLTEVLRPEGGDWELGYDARGNRIEVVEPRENATTYAYDLLNRMTSVEEPLETETSYAYDPAGNLTSLTDPRENTTELGYDTLGRLTTIGQPLEKTTSFTYDGVGNRLTRTTAAGTVSFEYDAANRLQGMSAGETTLRSFDYDPAGRLTGALDAQGDEITIGYDDDGRPISIDDDRGQTVAREYDSRGNVVKQVDGRGTLEYGYDKLSRMTSLTDPQAKALGFGYDPEGNLTEVELPNGVVTSTAYDNAGRVAEITALDPEEAVLESLEYEYDPFGNRTSQVDRLAQKTTYAYDPLNRLTQFDPPGEGSTSYAYDDAGNRTQAGTTTYSFDALNQLTSASNGTTYDYDDAGRLIEADHGEQATTYMWSPLDELIAVDDGSQEVTYDHDSLGRQATRQEGSTMRPTHYGDLSDIPILDTDAEGQSTMSYVQGPEGLIEQRSGEATSFPLPDAHGDITAILDEATEVTSRQTYDPWGTQLSGPSLEMGWLGAQQRRSDPALGLVQMGVRAYAPALGRFQSEDPVLVVIGMGQLADRYAYAANNPPNLTDLTGRSIFEDIAQGTSEMVESWAEDPFNFGDPRDLVTSAQEYWVESESPFANVAGPTISMIDLAVNPDRLAHYIKNHPWTHKQILADCYDSGHPARAIGGLIGGAGGFVMGVSSALDDQGVRAVGVGAVSGGAGAAAGGGIGALGGCAIGVIGGLVR